MNYKTAPAEKSTVKVTITYSKDEWDEAIGKAYTRTRGKYSVPGFRKGKAPRPVLENFYGKGVFFDEAFNILFSATYPDIIAKEKDNFTAVGDPSLSVDEISDENGVKPPVWLPVFIPFTSISAFQSTAPKLSKMSRPRHDFGTVKERLYHSALSAPTSLPTPERADSAQNGTSIFP